MTIYKIRYEESNKAGMTARTERLVEAADEFNAAALLGQQVILAQIEAAQQGRQGDGGIINILAVESLL